MTTTDEPFRPELIADAKDSFTWDEGTPAERTMYRAIVALDAEIARARAAAWREGFVTAMGMEMGYGTAPGAYEKPTDDFYLDAWNPYTGDGYCDPFEDED